MLVDVLKELSAEDRKRVEGRLRSWEKSPREDKRRTLKNLQRECVMDRIALKSLLQLFSAKFGVKGVSSEKAYNEACWDHQFSGRKLKGKRPTIVGRAIELEQYAELIKRAATDARLPFEKRDAIDAITRAAREGSSSFRGQFVFHRAELGNRPVIWATFNPKTRDGNPFESMPDQDLDTIRTACGLGHYRRAKCLILLAYKPKLGRRNLDLHCPTVAEACLNAFFRVMTDIDEEHGWTEPLMPNPRKLERQPEVVHRKITGESLVFPIYLAQ
jgi:hypothetical protein